MNWKKVLVFFSYGILMMLIGVALTITALDKGIQINIPRIEWSTWTDSYDLQLNVADGNVPVTGHIEAVASK